jgi:hypothetical protein
VNESTAKIIPHVNHFRRPSGAKVQLKLEMAVKLWGNSDGGLSPDWEETLMGFPVGWTNQIPKAFPTPTARDYKDSGPNTNYKGLAARSQLAGVVGGAINPDWSETLMGFPAGWTRVGQQVQESVKNLGNRQGLRRLSDLPKREKTG